MKELVQNCELNSDVISVNVMKEDYDSNVREEPKRNIIVNR